MTENTITIHSTDEDLMEVYEAHRRNANGEAAGNEADSPAEAAEREGWTVIRTIVSGTNHPGCPVLAQDSADRLWVINDLDGPWAIQVA